jgi:hypothetical protein
VLVAVVRLSAPVSFQQNLLTTLFYTVRCSLARNGSYGEPVILSSNSSGESRPSTVPSASDWPCHGVSACLDGLLCAASLLTTTSSHSPRGSAC